MLYTSGSQLKNPTSLAEIKSDFIGGEQRLAKKSLSKRKGLLVCFGTKMGKLVFRKVDPSKKVI